ncbi:hypothetical protein [Mesorhizobium sp. NZP2298]|uniref:hypothetical protein n=1 Tax=Mesorhizobium sp. NZP2298 TaxID=2483403 RepID=UPI0015519C05|nr:hypothetical protein [Mesorhizobium sp. NZP2298]
MTDRPNRRARRAAEAALKFHTAIYATFWEQKEMMESQWRVMVLAKLHQCVCWLCFDDFAGEPLSTPSLRPATLAEQTIRIALPQRRRSNQTWLWAEKYNVHLNILVTIVLGDDGGFIHSVKYRLKPQ